MFDPQFSSARSDVDGLFLFRESPDDVPHLVVVCLANAAVPDSVLDALPPMPDGEWCGPLTNADLAAWLESVREF